MLIEPTLPIARTPSGPNGPSLLQGSNIICSPGLRPLAPYAIADKTDRTTSRNDLNIRIRGRRNTKSTRHRTRRPKLRCRTPGQGTPNLVVPATSLLAVSLNQFRGDATVFLAAPCADCAIPFGNLLVGSRRLRRRLGSRQTSSPLGCPRDEAKGSHEQHTERELQTHPDPASYPTVLEDEIDSGAPLLSSGCVKALEGVERRQRGYLWQTCVRMASVEATWVAV